MKGREKNSQTITVTSAAAALSVIHITCVVLPTDRYSKRLDQAKHLCGLLPNRIKRGLPVKKDGPGASLLHGKSSQIIPIYLVANELFTREGMWSLRNAANIPAATPDTTMLPSCLPVVNLHAVVPGMPAGAHRRRGPQPHGTAARAACRRTPRQTPPRRTRAARAVKFAAQC